MKKGEIRKRKTFFKKYLTNRYIGGIIQQKFENTS